jgi:hypothetical protein
MELLIYPKTDYLLDASLESLHAESQAWLQNIDFWTDEMAFFYKLLHKKELIETYPSRELAAIEKELIKVYGERLEKARTEIQSHERLLGALVKSTSFVEDENYREKHRKLVLEIFDIQVLIRSFKKKVFDFIKK